MSSRLLTKDINRTLLWSGVALQLLMTVLSLLTDELWLALVPIVILTTLYGTALSIHQHYLVLFAILPFSVEMEFSGIGLDFPTELLLIYVTGWIGLLLVRDYRQIVLTRWGFLLLLFLIWGWLCTLMAEHPLLSTKFMIAKMWYVIPFFYGAHYAIRNVEDWDRLMRILVSSVTIVGVYTFIRHGLEGWAFDQRMYAGAPFMRNHVNYACLLLMSLPVCRYLYQRIGGRWFWILALILLFFSYFAYARIVYLCLGIAIIGIVAIRTRLLPIMIVAGMILGIGVMGYTLSSDHLVEMAPDYTNTISHDRFDDMLSATYEGQDISTMERLHRWVAGLEMTRERPMFGFGPSNFYSSYKDYTVNSFQTYVSDNPEHSGIHNYYLMMLVEQGIPGLLFFLALLLGGVFYAQSAYYTCDPSHRPLVELSTSWLLIIATISLLNDMLEVIKVGPFFFLAAFILFLFLPHMKKIGDV